MPALLRFIHELQATDRDNDGDLVSCFYLRCKRVF